MEKVFGFAKKHIASLVFLLISILIIGWIFNFSAEPSDESNETSAGVCYFISTLLVDGFSDLSEAEKEAKVGELVPIVRKAAHFSIYAALGFFLMLSAGSYYLELKKKIKRDVAAAIALGVSLFYAATDEFHQLFVEGRSGTVRDVCIDFCGALCGVLVAMLAFVIFIKIVEKRAKKETLQ